MERALCIVGCIATLSVTLVFAQPSPSDVATTQVALATTVSTTTKPTRGDRFATGLLKEFARTVDARSDGRWIFAREGVAFTDEVLSEIDSNPAIRFVVGPVRLSLHDSNARFAISSGSRRFKADGEKRWRLDAPAALIRLDNTDKAIPAASLIVAKNSDADRKHLESSKTSHQLRVNGVSLDLRGARTIQWVLTDADNVPKFELRFDDGTGVTSVYAIVVAGAPDPVLRPFSTERRLSSMTALRARHNTQAHRVKSSEPKSWFDDTFKKTATQAGVLPENTDEADRIYQAAVARAFPAEETDQALLERVSNVTVDDLRGLDDPIEVLARAMALSANIRGVHAARAIRFKQPKTGLTHTAVFGLYRRLHRESRHRFAWGASIYTFDESGTLLASIFISDLPGDEDFDIASAAVRRMLNP
jgi:hypothetical protein